MRSEILTFFSLQRQIFGVCPCCGELFRLSDCKVFTKEKPAKDWMDRLDARERRLETQEEGLVEKKAEIQERAREKGRKEAARKVERIDRVFTPRRLDPDDAKVLFHPIDYVVFDGMKRGEAMKAILLLDREGRTAEHRGLQKSIEQAVEKERYEWVTLRVGEDGSVRRE